MESTLTPTTETNSTIAADEGLLSPGNAEVYQSVSRSAVAAVVLGIFGLSSFFAYPLLLLPILGIVFAVLSLLAFRRYPKELLGKPLAIGGLLLCGGTAILAPSYHAFIYMTEVPEGYTRVDFMRLTSGKGQADRPTRVAIDLNGEAIFLKGYIHPSSMDSVMAKRFVLVPDLGTCCFGGQPPLTNMVEVSLSGDQYARKSMRQQKLAGTFRVNADLKPVAELTGVYYQLRADIIK